MKAIGASNASLREAHNTQRNHALDLEHRWYSATNQTQGGFVELAAMKDRSQQGMTDPKSQENALRGVVEEKQRKIDEKQREVARLEEDMCESDGEVR